MVFQIDTLSFPYYSVFIVLIDELWRNDWKFNLERTSNTETLLQHKKLKKKYSKVQNPVVLDKAL